MWTLPPRVGGAVLPLQKWIVRHAGALLNSGTCGAGPRAAACAALGVRCPRVRRCHLCFTASRHSLVRQGRLIRFLAHPAHAAHAGAQLQQGQQQHCDRDVHVGGEQRDRAAAASTLNIAAVGNQCPHVPTTAAATAATHVPRSS